MPLNVVLTNNASFFVMRQILTYRKLYCLFDNSVLQKERDFVVNDELGMVIYPTGVWVMHMAVPATAEFYTNYKLVAENDLGTTEHEILMTRGKYTLQIILFSLIKEALYRMWCE